MSRRVLLISHHHPDLVRGGGQQLCYDLFEALKQTSYEPVLLASVQRNMHPTLFKSGAHITGFDGRKDEFLYLCYGYDHIWHRNREHVGLEKFESFLSQVAPDVIHFHHFLFLGMEFLTAARRHLDLVGGRLILTLHEFLAICMANGQMVRTDKSLCHRSSPVRCSECFPHLSPEFFSMRNMWIKHHFEMVDLFVSPSQFLRRVYEEWGIPPEKIVDIPHGYRPRRRSEAAATSSDATPRPRNRFAFFGQLIDNKGLLVLFDAIRTLRSRDIKDFSVEIHGANLKFASEEFQKEFNAFEAEENRSKLQRVRWHGAFEPSDLDRLMEGIDWVVVPSTWWENSPMVIVEAFMFGKPVICSNIGGMSEAVRDNVDGLHFVARNSESLADTMSLAMSEVGLWERLHENTLLPPTAASMARQHIDLCYDSKRLGSHTFRGKAHAGLSEAS